MTDEEIENMDFGGKELVLACGTQAHLIHQNPTAQHLRVEFVQPHFLPDGDDLHLFTTVKSAENVAEVIEKLGGDLSKATVLTYELSRRKEA